MDTEAQWEASSELIPRSFVVKRGKVGNTLVIYMLHPFALPFLIEDLGNHVMLQVDMSVTDLVKDLRGVMQPNTAGKLKERRDNGIKDYVNLAGPLKVTHLMMLTQTLTSVNFKVGRMPQGPTLSFKVRTFGRLRGHSRFHAFYPLCVTQVMNYTLSKNVRALQKRPMDPTVRSTCWLPNHMASRPPLLSLSRPPPQPLHQYSPLVILNNFGETLPSAPKHMTLMASVFQGLFPPVDVGVVRLSQCRRVVLFHYHKVLSSVMYRSTVS